MKRVLACVLSFGLVAAPAAADSDPPPFDFTDEFYRANGVEPTLLEGRVTGMDPVSVIDVSPDPTRRDVRVLLTIPAFGDSGDINYFGVFAEVPPEAFTDDVAGRKARAIAEEAPIYIFPRAGGVATEILPKRQEDLIDLRHGYFSGNPLGLWVFVFVHYTEAALATPAGQEALADLADRNGVDADGTPVIATLGEIESLADDGFIALVRRATDGSEGPPWSVCPVLEDPRGGAIAIDAFLAFTTGPTGEHLPSLAEFINEFGCLKHIHDWCRGKCAADFDGSGELDFFDFLRFQDRFAGGDEEADLNRDGALDFFDFLEFQSLFAAGCA